MPCLVLAIDGGGLRGIIPVLILKHIEQKVQESNQSERKLVTYFNLVSGTSTGGLIACGATLGTNQDTLSTKYNFEFIESIYRERGPEIFPYQRWWAMRKYRGVRNILKPKFGRKGIETVLTDMFGLNRILDCIRPIVVTTYDVNANEPFYFSSRKALMSGNLNHKLVDICRATSAGPTYLPAHGMWEPRRMICVDGGVFQNNPTITGLVEVMKHPETYNGGKPLQLEDVFVLSIGTGRFNKIIPAAHAYNGGQWNWVKPMIDISMWGNSQAVNEHMDRLLLLPTGKKHYLRLNVRILNEKFADMAVSSVDAMNHYSERFVEDYMRKPEVQADLDQWLVDSGM